jgi:hypothetical protein
MQWPRDALIEIDLQQIYSPKHPIHHFPKTFGTLSQPWRALLHSKSRNKSLDTEHQIYSTIIFLKEGQWKLAGPASRSNKFAILRAADCRNTSRPRRTPNNLCCVLLGLPLGILWYLWVHHTAILDTSMSHPKLP